MKAERNLLQAAQQGNSKALEELLAGHEKQIYRFGLRMCGNEEAARDVLQETLLAAFRNLRQFRGDAALSTWLYQIARSVCLKSRRRGAGEPATLESLEGVQALRLETSEAGPDASAHARELGEILQVAIQSLSADHREVVILRDVEGLSAEEAAAVVGVEVGALRSRLHRARMELRQRISDLLGEVGEGGGPAPCPELAQELVAYAAAEIDQATCARIEEHLRDCQRCQGACAALQRTVSLCRQIPGDDVPPAVRTAVRRALSAAAGLPASAE